MTGITKYTRYLESSRKLIDDEFSKRGIDKDSIWKFITKHKVTEGACHRCGSNKFLNNTEQCAVCGKDIKEDEEKRSKWDEFLEWVGEILETVSH